MQREWPKSSIGAVLFVGAGGALAQKPTQFHWDDTNNRLGIGTNSPGEKLTVSSGNVAVDNGYAVVAKDNLGIYRRTFFLDVVNNYGARNEALSGSAYYGISSASNTTGNIYFQIAGSNIAAFDTAGKFGIGTTSPSHKLHVYSPGVSVVAKLESTDTNSLFQLVSGGQTKLVYFGATGNNLTFWTDGTERMRINESGNVGIGISPSARLHIAGSQTGLLVDSVSGYYPIQVNYAGSYVFRVAPVGGDVESLGTFSTASGFRATAFGAYMGVQSSARFTFNNSSPSILAHPLNASTVVFGVRGASGQSANLTEWQDSTGTVMSGILKVGVPFSTYGFVGTTVAGFGYNTYYDGGQWKNYNAADAGSLFRFSSGGMEFYLTSLGANPTLTGPLVLFGNSANFYAKNSATVPVIVKGAASQTANLQEWQNSSGGVLTAIKSDGKASIATTESAHTLNVGGDVRLYTNTGRYYVGAINNNIFQMGHLSGSNYGLAVPNLTSGLFFDSGSYYSPTLKGGFIDNASAVSVIIDTNSAYTISGAKIISFRNLGTEKAYIDKDGGGYFAGKLTVGVPTVADTNARAMIVVDGTNTNGKGLVVQSTSGASGNILEVQNSTGTVQHAFQVNGSYRATNIQLGSEVLNLFSNETNPVIRFISSVSGADRPEIAADSVNRGFLFK